MSALKTPIARPQDRTTLIDDTDPNNVYIGEAIIGSLPSASVWALRLINTTGGIISIKWANGSYSPNNVWNNRSTYTYS